MDHIPRGRSIGLALLAFGLIYIGGLGVSSPAHAQELDPAIYVLVDTSGSMLDTSTGGEFTYGDGSLEHPHDLAVTDPSRLYQAKQALANVVFAYGEVRWGLARFKQNIGENYFCNCHEELDDNTASPCSSLNPGLYQEVDASGNPVCRSCDYYLAYPDYDLPAATNPGSHDRVCINYAGGIFVSADGNYTPCLDPFADLSNPVAADVLDGADILVALADDNEDRILMWVDHQETDFRSGFDANGDHCFASGTLGDCELRGMGGTPIGGALRDLYDRMSLTDLSADPYKGCRPYSVIVLTDGANSCDTDPQTWAGNLQSVPDQSSYCDAGTPCPPNASCVANRCEYQVKVHVIGFALGPMEIQGANLIAEAGGTDHAILADNEAEITAAMAQIIADSFLPEQCNGVDDDCDGDIDEGFPVGDPCSKGVGECLSTGQYECDPADPNAVICNAADIAPGTEICDGLDNDCDGSVDEDDVCCDGPEMCDGLDNYCGSSPAWMSDGDEDPRVWDVYPTSSSPGTPQSCGLDEGMCTSGQMTCSTGALQCVGADGPWTEQCDTDDWNCNGLPNDVPPQSCVISNSYGDCPGVQICELPGAWGDCMGQDPAPEICNGQDDNCDGTVDEGLDYQFACGVGECAHQVTFCVGGVEQTCDPLQGAAAESCDGKDNDCDGQTDEGLGQTTCGLGICEHTIQNCVGGVSQTCDPMQGATTESCNGLDDDCDGTVDDSIADQACYPSSATGCTEVSPGSWDCVGQCGTGLRSCSGGTWGGCAGATTPVAEVCDTLDNDCNGTADDGLGTTTCGLGNCLHTVQNCQGGVVQICDPLQGAGPETCDGEDDNCNGVVDDGITRSCYTGTAGCTETSPGVWDCTGECSAGAESCVVGGSGSWAGTCVGEQLPDAELCDGLDNDCDGTVDNGVTRQCYPYGSGCTAQADGTYDCMGACAPGTATCVEGGSGDWGSCVSPTGPVPETCDGVDNDCDGDTDEDALGNPLTQSCVKTQGSWSCSGTQTCTSGGWGSCNAPEPRDEAWADPNVDPSVCDLVDDNCNGVVNDGVPAKQCSITNAHGTCTGTETCNEQGNWVGCTAQTPAAETCNGVDDDCDGDTDEDGSGNPLTQACYTGTAATRGVGACQDGVRTCSGGGWGSCAGQVLPQPEICDGVDNDCDGLIDEDDSGNPLTNPCQVSNAHGVCLGVQPCTGNPADPWGACTAATPAPEQCDGLDQNCNGLVDEGVTRPCFGGGAGCTETSPGVWSCEGECETGIERCASDGSGTWEGVCEGDRLAQPEVCDGLDNDCDGTADDNITRACYTAGVGCTARADGTGYDCVGTCRAGQQSCVVGATVDWTTCQNETGPAAESCDGTDNDCDGLTDEDAAGDPLTLPCDNTNAEGTCQGLQTCTGGSFGACSAAVPAAEQWDDPTANPAVCDTVDQNCNGVINDGISPRTCTETNQHGTCTGTQSCTAQGSWTACTAKVPQAEVCNGVDDDCDGQVDEDASGNPLTQACYTGPGATQGVGACTDGLRTCTNGGWGPCAGQVLPTLEVCDAQDNDCDGDTDEDGSGNPLVQACQAQSTHGTCLGQQTCTSVPGSLWTACDAQVPEAEVCDGVDNNCDGVIDGISRACYPFADGCAPDGSGGFNCDGICHEGIEVCPQLATPAAGNSFGTCNLALGPATEQCNGLDDDCDGQVDENQDGTALSRPCYWPGYGANTGCTTPGSCVGACREGIQVCGDVSVGQWGQCQGEVTPSTEVCDATDNDCDGLVDEPADMPWIGQPCPASLGICNGIWACNNGVKECVGGHVNPGRCNGLDDDCDGVTDELDELQQDPTYGQSCGSGTGECQEGTMECMGGSWQCVGAVEPSEEVCDGADNDCDGQVDVGAECPPVGPNVSYCIEAACRVECDGNAEFPCPGGMECVQRDHEGEPVTVCMPIVGECGGQTCPEGWICENDQCVDPCDPNPCQDWEECREGQCVDTSCSGVGRSCPAGQYCVDHACVTDPCAELGCGADGEVCVRDCDAQICTAACEPACLCPAGQRCDPDGACVPDPCADSECLAGARCDPLSGECEPDPCAAVLCQGLEVCFEGECTDDPCDALICPPQFACELQTTTDATGNPAPYAVCEPDPALWVEGEQGDRYLMTGSGCQCRADASGRAPAPTTPAALSLLGLLGLLWRRRRAARITGRGGAHRPTAARTAGRRLASASALRMALVLALLALATALGASGCRLDPWNTGRDGGWDLTDAQVADAQVTPDASPDACVPQEEVCNGLDDDCDGVADNGFDLDQDPNNCGSCGHVCEIPNALATCEGGTCVLAGCQPGHWDVNEDPTDGCEYACHRTNDGTELCDGMDNDCDGAADEDFDLQTDPLNCGACSNVCVFLNGFGACVGGQCALDACRGGYVDVDGSSQNGCECRMDLVEGTTPCVEGQPGACGAGEVCADVTEDGSSFCATIPADGCDGRDNDCDGQTDEDFAAVLPSTQCYTFTSGCTQDASGNYGCTGQCGAGTWTCPAGELVCVGQTGPQAESCNDLDDDCNTVVDDGVDKLTDPNNCGSCGFQCGPLLPNAIPGCVNGSCTIVDCLPGYWDLDAGQPGCEYACTVTNGGVEACGDGLDNDCNGQTDEGFDLQADPNNCGACGHSCEVSKPYGTAVVTPDTCLAGQCRFQCLPSFYDRDGDLPTQGESGNGCEEYCEITHATELCDGIDNDCNGQTDEGFDLATDLANCGACGRDCDAIKGANTTATACAASVCQYACLTDYVDLNGDLAAGDAGNGCECHVDPEQCNGTDDDCDGVVDNQGAAGCTDYYRDADGDGYGDPADHRCLCAPDSAARYTVPVAQATDCNDANVGQHPGATEVCDGIDNDCDGETDAVGGTPLSRSCYTGPAGTESNAPCTTGTQTCSGGNWSATCVGEVTPQIETCDTVDNDCDGTPDDGFDLTSDPDHCGGCGNQCSVLVPNAVSTCESSSCVLLSCLPGYHDLDAGAPGCEYACTYQNGGVKTCGSPDDNDCNGLADDTEFDLAEDPEHCGACDHSCEAQKPFGTEVRAAPDGCNGGVCQFDCLPDYYDRDGDLPVDGEASNGCEEYCVPTDPATEVCDGIDNDCDGQTDEGFDLQTDVDHCGACGRACAGLAGANTTVTGCAAGACQFACVTGYVDVNGDLALGSAGNGCECQQQAEACGDGVDNDCDGLVDEEGAAGCTTWYRDQDGDTYGDAGDSKCLCAAGSQYTASNDQDCNDLNAAINPLATEVCDGLDNDCNGETDAVGGTALSRSCYTGPAGTESNAPCTAGTQTCTGGAWSATCAGEVTPQTEVCDTVDNDCDGTPDDGFDLTSDPDHCGACNVKCSVEVENAVSTCSGGTCQIVACHTGYYDINTDPSDGCEYACTLQNGGVKTCGSTDDNDCNGTADHLEFDTNENPDHCGACNHSCEASKPPGTAVRAAPDGCNAGVCYYDCLSGYVDLDGDRSEGSNGCECAQTNGGTEICDDLDNDCDGSVDEHVDKQTDPDHCGSCGNACASQVPANAALDSPACQSGACRFVCQTGHWDLDGDLHSGAGSNGCEYACTASGAETCNGADDDCDGLTDEDASGQPLSRSCYPLAYGAGNGCTAPGTCVGVCREGTETCSGGAYGSCLGAITPGNKICGSTSDNDCNGLQDDTEFDLSSDIENCGTCGNSCVNNLPPNAGPDSPGCVSGQCRYVCLSGFADLDGDLHDGLPTPADGCEYTCPRYPTLTYEECNDIDDDCDGDVDEAADLESPPAICYQGVAGSPCQGSAAQCVAPGGGLPKGWYCDYPASVETLPGDPNTVLTSETLCDGADGDCDGLADDEFNLGAECDNGQLGACRDVGEMVCDTDPTAAPVCDLSVLPDPDVAAQGPEICDDLDNDCDGLTDENAANPGPDPSYVVDDTVLVNVGGADVLVYSFEASRPTATAGNPGTGTDVRACSRNSVHPWNRVTRQQAAEACARAGMRLCGAAEWLGACNASGDAYPYGDTFDPQACNGAENATGGGALLDSGTLGTCTSAGSGALDMSGNLREWTTDLISYTDGGKAVYRVRGGSYTDVGPTPPYSAGETSGLACDFENAGYVEDVLAANVGFRCCTTCGNGTVDPGEDCDPAVDAGCNPVTCAWNPCGDGNLDAGETCDCGLDPDNLPAGCLAPNGWAGANCDNTCGRPPEDCSVLTGDEDADGDANCADADCATAYHCDPANDDADGDGFTPAMGDCCDTGAEAACGGLAPGTIHPAALEACGDGVDNNCNGAIDAAEPDKDGDGAAACVSGARYDCDDWDSSRSPEHLEDPNDAADNDCSGDPTNYPIYDCDCSANTYHGALDLCNGTVVTGQSGMEANSDSDGYGIRQLLASSSIGPYNGDSCDLLVLSSGHIDADQGQGNGASYLQIGYNMGNGLQIDAINGVTYDILDQVQYHLVLDVPTNVHALEFRFVFFSAEYPEYTCTEFNDRFRAVIQSTHSDYTGYSCAGGSVPVHPTYGDYSHCRNISFDGSGNDISVNAAFFDDPRDTATWSYNNLAGTGYLDPCLDGWWVESEPWECTDCTGTSGNPPGCGLPSSCDTLAYEDVGSSTAWLQTVANVVPGERIRIIFDVHDESDSYFDSRTIIDGFRWRFASVSGPSTTK